MWHQIVLTHPDQTEICLIERNPIVAGKVGAEELAEFLEEIEDCSPTSAVSWLRIYLAKVETIYSIQILFKGADRDQGWAVIETVKQAILADVSGIIQAD